MSIKKGSGDTGLDGIAYRIYGCGTYTDSPEIVVPLDDSLNKIATLYDITHLDDNIPHLDLINIPIIKVLIK